MNNRIPVTREMASQIEEAKAAARIPAGVRKQIQREAIGSQKVTANKIYYSRVRFGADITLAEQVATQYDFVSGKRYAFGYQLQQEVDGHAGHRATYADTNILEARSTNKGEKVLVKGIAIRNTPMTDAYFANMLDMFVSVSLRIDNNDLLRLGNPSDVPGAGQNTNGSTWIVPPALEETQARFHPALKGHERADNMLVLAEPIIWTPGGIDSKLDIEFDLTRTLDFPAATARVEDLAVVGVTAYDAPTEDGAPGTFVDYFVKLYCDVISPRGNNE